MASTIVLLAYGMVVTGLATWAYIRMLKAEDALSEQRRYSWRKEDELQQALADADMELELTQREVRRQRRRANDAWRESPQGQQWLSRQKKTRLDVN